MIRTNGQLTCCFSKEAWVSSYHCYFLNRLRRNMKSGQSEILSLFTVFPNTNVMFSCNPLWYAFNVSFQFGLEVRAWLSEERLLFQRSKQWNLFAHINLSGPKRKVWKEAVLPAGLGNIVESWLVPTSLSQNKSCKIFSNSECTIFGVVVVVVVVVRTILHFWNAKSPYPKK